MVYILYIDTSTRNCSVALANGSQLLAQKMEKETRSHAKILPLLIKDLLNECQVSFKDLKAIGVASGPGSYTGLRIGMSVAKGLAFALELPIMTFDTLYNLGISCLKSINNENAICVVCMNSRKGEVYFAIINKKFEVIKNSQPAVIEDIVIDNFDNNIIFTAGDEINRLNFSNFNIELLHLPQQFEASNFVEMGFIKFERKDFENLIDVEPNYLKPFISKIF